MWKCLLWEQFVENLRTRDKNRKRMWMHNIPVPSYNEVAFHTYAVSKGGQSRGLDGLEVWPGPRAGFGRDSPDNNVVRAGFK
jgi:hypothetical protein